MLLGEMNFSRLMIYVQEVEGDNIMEQDKKAMTIFSRNRMVEISHKGRISFQLQPLHKLVFYPPRTGMTKSVEHQGLSLAQVFKEPRFTPHDLCVVKPIQASVSQQK